MNRPSKPISVFELAGLRVGLVWEEQFFRVAGYLPVCRHNSTSKTISAQIPTYFHAQFLTGYGIGRVLQCMFFLCQPFSLVFIKKRREKNWNSKFRCTMKMSEKAVMQIQRSIPARRRWWGNFQAGLHEVLELDKKLRHTYSSWQLNVCDIWQDKR